MTSSPPNSVTEHGTSEVEPVLSGATSDLHDLDAAAQQLGGAAIQQLGEAATQELGDSLAVPLSLEMDVLYDPPGGTRVTEAYAKTEYDLFPKLCQWYGCS